VVSRLVANVPRWQMPSATAVAAAANAPVGAAWAPRGGLWRRARHHLGRGL